MHLDCEMHGNCATCEYAENDELTGAVVSCCLHPEKIKEHYERNGIPVITGEYVLTVEAMRELAAEVKAAKEEREASETVHVVHDPVEHPAHYNQGGIETIDVIEAWGLDYCLGNAVKYISRAGKKDPEKTVEDLRKARWYLDREIKRMGAGE